MPKVEPKKNEPIPIGVRALQYLALQDKEKELAKEKKAVRTVLEAHLDEKGVKNDKGHIVAITEHAGQKCEVKNECRVTATLVPDAQDILKASIPDKVLKKLYQTVTVFREEVLTAFIEDGTIPESVAAKIFESKEGYAFKVKKL